MAVEAPKVVEHGEKIFGEVPVFIGGKWVLLPLMEKNGVNLVYLNPSEPELENLCASTIAHLAEPLKPKHVLAVESSKSKTAIAKACQQMSTRPSLSFFQKGVAGSPQMEYAEKNAAFSVQYSPITAKAPLVMVASPEQVDLLRDMDPESLLIADDVLSTWATVSAVHKIMGKVYRKTYEEIARTIPKVALMQECPVDEDGSMNLIRLPNSAVAVRTPVFHGDVPDMKAVSYYINYPNPPVNFGTTS